MKEIVQPFWWFTGMIICIFMFEILNKAFKEELNRLFNAWDSSHHEVIVSEHSTALYWDLVDFIKELMKRALNILTFFSGVIVFIALLFKAEASGPFLNFCVGIITYRFAIFNNWLAMKKYGEDKRPDRPEDDENSLSD
jgi:hypothetical protein